MPNINARNLDRYTTAFLDYNRASTKFHEAVCKIAKNKINTFESIEELAHVLEVEHAHFIECAQRIMQTNSLNRFAINIIS
mgnify:CR=1 FL=1